MNLIADRVDLRGFRGYNGVRCAVFSSSRRDVASPSPACDTDEVVASLLFFSRSPVPRALTWDRPRTTGPTPTM